jgi:hypothetical protein
MQAEPVAVGEMAAQDSSDDPVSAGYQDGLQAAEFSGGPKVSERAA